MENKEDFIETEFPKNIENDTLIEINISNSSNIQPSIKSKRQIKRDKNKEKWLETKAMKKKLKKLQQHEKQNLKKSKQNIENKKENNVNNIAEEQIDYKIMPNESKNQNEIIEINKSTLIVKKLKDEYKKCMENAPQIIIDCSFQDQLTQKELNSLCIQIGYCHSANKKQSLHCKMTITTYKSKVKEKLDKFGARQWGILLLEEHYLSYYDQKQMVYLSGDAEEDLEEVDPKQYNKNENCKIYIVGGLVDHNRLKKGTYNRAKTDVSPSHANPLALLILLSNYKYLSYKNEIGIIAKRLPISKYMKLSKSGILTVNHVFEILVRRFNNESWKEAFENTIPKRKVADDVKKEDKLEIEDDKITT